MKPPTSAEIELGRLYARVEFEVAASGVTATVRPTKLRLLLKPRDAAWNAEPIEVGHFTYLEDKP